MRTKPTQADGNAGNASRSIREKRHVRHPDISAATVDKSKICLYRKQAGNGQRGGARGRSRGSFPGRGRGNRANGGNRKSEETEFVWVRDKKGNSVKKKVKYVKTLVDCEDEPEYDTFD